MAKLLASRYTNEKGRINEKPVTFVKVNQPVPRDLAQVVEVMNSMTGVWTPTFQRTPGDVTRATMTLRYLTEVSHTQAFYETLTKRLSGFLWPARSLLMPPTRNFEEAVLVFDIQKAGELVNALRIIAKDFQPARNNCNQG